MSPKKRLFQYEIHLPTMGHVSFRECSPAGSVSSKNMVVFQAACDRCCSFAMDVQKSMDVSSLATPNFKTPSLPIKLATKIFTKECVP